MSKDHPTAPTGKKRVIIWVQFFGDRDYFMLQWHDPETGKRKSKSAGTCNSEMGEQKRADLEYELNNGLYSEPAHTSWKKLRELYEAEPLPNLRPGSSKLLKLSLDQFEVIVKPGALRGITERSISTFVRGLRERKGLQSEYAQASTVDTKLDYLKGVLSWAVEQDYLARWGLRVNG